MGIVKKGMPMSLPNRATGDDITIAHLTSDTHTTLPRRHALESTGLTGKEWDAALLELERKGLLKVTRRPGLDPVIHLVVPGRMR